MKVIRRKIFIEEINDYKMCTLYVCRGKYGTHGTTLFYLFEKPEIGKIIKAIVSESWQYDNDSNLMFAEIREIEVWDINKDNGYIYVNRI